MNNGLVNVNFDKSTKKKTSHFRDFRGLPPVNES